MATLKATTYRDLQDAERHYLNAVDDAAADARRLDPSLAEVYREKVAQATAGGGPLLAAEAKTLGANIESVITSVLRNHKRREERIHSIELSRIKAKAAIRGAASAATMHRILKEFREAL